MSFKCRRGDYGIFAFAASGSFGVYFPFVFLIYGMMWSSGYDFTWLSRRYATVVETSCRILKLQNVIFQNAIFQACISVPARVCIQSIINVNVQCCFFVHILLCC